MINRSYIFEVALGLVVVLFAVSPIVAQNSPFGDLERVLDTGLNNMGFAAEGNIGHFLITDQGNEFYRCVDLDTEIWSPTYALPDEIGGTFASGRDIEVVNGIGMRIGGFFAVPGNTSLPGLFGFNGSELFTIHASSDPISVLVQRQMEFCTELAG